MVRAAQVQLCDALHHGVVGFRPALERSKLVECSSRLAAEEPRFDETQPRLRESRLRRRGAPGAFQHAVEIAHLLECLAGKQLQRGGTLLPRQHTPAQCRGSRELVAPQQARNLLEQVASVHVSLRREVRRRERVFDRPPRPGRQNLYVAETPIVRGALS